MIFVGFGFLMTFLKKYGLSAVSLNMLCAVVCLQWATLVYGFFHFHTECPKTEEGECEASANLPSYLSEGKDWEQCGPGGEGVPECSTEGLTGWQWIAPGKMYLNLVDSMLYSDFAAAAVLISFGVVIGKTSPLQLIVMALIEIVVFFGNEVIGRKYLKVQLDNYLQTAVFSCFQLIFV